MLLVDGLPSMLSLYHKMHKKAIVYNKNMTVITTDDVQALARLSSLQLSDSEVADLAADLQNILKYVEQLGQLDTTGVEPTYQVTGLQNVWRDDTAAQSDVSREALLALAPEQADDHVKVPQVL